MLQARASGLKDTSILPDLCASHRQQLLVMIGDAYLECKEFKKAELIYKDALQVKKQAKPQKKVR